MRSQQGIIPAMVRMLAGCSANRTRIRTEYSLKNTKA